MKDIDDSVQNDRTELGMADLDRTVVRDVLRSELAELLDVVSHDIEDRISFREQGLNSLKALTFVERLSKRLDLSLQPTLVWRCSSIDSLLRYICDGEIPVAEQAQYRLHENETVAIVGLGCRLPAGVDGPVAFWQSLQNNLDGISEVPAERWNIAEWHDQDAEAPGKMNTRWGGFLDDVAGFDNDFFSISAAEALQMDPQQRLALEVSWSALEDASIIPAELTGSRTGVFFGTMWQEYARLIDGSAESIKQHSAAGADNSIIPARIAYGLGLQGPVMTVNTACSSSLVSVHLAAQSLLRGESNLALAGGVNLMLTPHATVGMTKFGAMNPAGQCRAFDAEANGYVRGEGCGVAVLRRLSDAQRQGDRIYAVLRGSAVNSDGASNGLSAPNQQAQSAVVREAWQVAGIDLQDVAYIEAHGTGTILGDPIEADALGEVFAGGREQALLIGSVKSNVGHLEGAAGITSLIKVALSLHHGELPASLHYEKPNPHIDFDGLKLQVVDQRRCWPQATKRYAGISGFGYGGTNAHLALEQAPGIKVPLLCLAANSKSDLQQQAVRVMQRLPELKGDAELAELTSQVGDGNYRLAMTADQIDAVTTRLHKLQEGDFEGVAHLSQPPQVVFVFSGHGSQWLGMGRDLLTREPVFYQTMKACDDWVLQQVGWSLIDELLATEANSRISHTAVVQPLIFALQVSLARTLEAWGIKPDLVIGQSIGEAAAAVVSGGLSLQDGLHLIINWSAIIEDQASGHGAMLLASIDATEAERIADNSDVCISAYISPSQTSFSGSNANIDRLYLQLQQDGVQVFRINIDYASHSQLMEPLLDTVREQLDDLKPQIATVPMWSSTYNRLLDGTELTAEYWAQNLRQPTQLQQSVTSIADLATSCFVELAPHPVLVHGIKSTLSALPNHNAVVLGAIWRDEAATSGLQDLAGQLWARGVEVDQQVLRGQQVSRRDLAVTVLPISAKSPVALRQQAQQLAQQIQGQNISLTDLSLALALQRSQFEYRAAVAADSLEQALTGLEALAADNSHPVLVLAENPVNRAGQTRVAAMFTGQGSQRLAMGKTLYETLPAYRQAFDDIAAAMRPHLSRPLLEVVFADDNTDEALLLTETAWTQPALFALEVALFRQWQAWGLQVDTVFGHSIGELSAIHVADILDLDDAAKLVCARGRLMQACETGGAMVALQASVQEVRSQLVNVVGRVDIAGLNSPSQTVISGDEQAVLGLAELFEQQGRRSSRLSVSHAFHSAHMDSMLSQYEIIASECHWRTPSVDVVSFVDGELASPETLLQPAYWARQVRQPVHFVDMLQHVQQRVDVCLELGPDAVLTAMAGNCLDTNRELPLLSSLRKSVADDVNFKRTVAELFTLGVPLDWVAVNAGPASSMVELPSYPFQHQRFWLQSQFQSDMQPQHRRRVTVESRLWNAVDAGQLESVAELLGIPAERFDDIGHLMPYLSAWHQQESADELLQDWLYDETWQMLPVSQLRSAKPTGTWVVVCGEDAGCNAIQDQLVTQLQTLIGATAQFHCLVASGGREQLLQQLQQCGDHIDVVISLTGLNEKCDGEAVLPQGLLQTLALSQAIIELKQSYLAEQNPAALKLWLLTQAAVSCADQEPLMNPLQGMMWGFGRVLGLEHPHCWGGLIDLPADAEEVVANRLLPALLSDDAEDQLALRDSGRLVRRLQRVAVEPQMGQWRGHGTALITGGSGGLASHLAQWLVKHGIEHIVLTSRRGGDAPGVAELSETLTELGAQVTVSRCDVSQRDDVETLLAELDSDDEMPLTVVAHLAGVLNPMAIDALGQDELAYELAAKVTGAWNLHQELGDWSLDAFILYGSGASLWGGGKQAAYGAANAAVDALARHRRAIDLPATVLHWGPWADGGMVDAEIEAQFRSRGLAPMKPSHALRGLEQALCGGRTSLGIVDLDWSVFAPAFCAARPRPLLDGIAEVREALAPAPSSEASVSDKSLRDELLVLDEADRHEHLRDQLAADLAAVLGLNDTDEIDPRRGFVDLGIDSLMAVQLAKRLQKRTGLTVPTTLTFDHPHLEACSRWALEQLLPEGSDQVRVQRGQTLAANAPIAVVGAGMRLPGEANDLESLWQVLAEQRDTLRVIPNERFDVDAIYDPEPGEVHKTYVKHAALLNDVAGFDAGLFGISASEAEAMDPQHRLLLEAAWSALEDTGVAAAELLDTETGVFIGAASGEYTSHLRSVEVPGPYAATGSLPCFSAGRLSYHLGLQGPALSIDTACSSSLVALSLACNAIRRGECQMALAAGVQVLADPSWFVMLSGTRALAPDGRCKTFSENADGYGRGEGVAVLSLMSLEQAQSQGRDILGVIRGCAVNHDGESSGITAPNGTSQQKVLRAALQDAGLEASDIDYIECHGTGTKLGDPIEVQALAAVYGKDRNADQPLQLGAVKSSLGHLESASGLAGICKVLASFRHQALPATQHTQPPNPHIPWDRLPVQVVDQLTDWPSRAGSAAPRRAAVSSFGLSGTNAHIVLEEAPLAASDVERDSIDTPLPLPLSARSETALRQQAQRWANWLQQQGETLVWADVVATAALRRTQFDVRSVIHSDDKDSAIAALQALATAEEHAGFSDPVAKPVGHKLAILFTGQGSQRLAMGQQLYQQYPVFKQAFDEIAEAMASHLSQPLTSVVFADADTDAALLLDQTAWTQPALFAIEVALFRQWQAWGLKPQALVGHSIGELAAIHVAGMLDLADAAKLVCARGRLMQACEAGGAMVAIQASERELREAIDQQPGRLDIAGLNSPVQTVVSGDETAVLAIAKQFEQQGRRCRRLSVSHAFHSPHMDSMLDDYRVVAQSCQFQTPRIAVISLVDGEVASDERLMQPDYWVQQVRRAVRFADAMSVLQQQGIRLFLECGPDGILAAMAANCLDDELDPDTDVCLLSSLHKDRDETRSLMAAFAELHCQRLELDWQGLFFAQQVPVQHRKVDLPFYPFERQRYWREPLPMRGLGQADSGWNFSYLPGERVEHPDGSLLFRFMVDPALQPELGDHFVYDRVVVAGSVHVANLLAVGAALFPGQPIELSEISFRQPLVLGHGPVQVNISCAANDDGSWSAEIATRDPQGGWITHAVGMVAQAESLDELQQMAPFEEAAEPMAQDDYVAAVERNALQWGEKWWWTHTIHTDSDEGLITAHFDHPAPLDIDALDIPVSGGLLDNIFAMVVTQMQHNDSSVQLPFALDRLLWDGQPIRDCYGFQQFNKARTNASQIVSDLALYRDLESNPALYVDSLTDREAPADRFLRGEVQPLYQVEAIHESLLAAEDLSTQRLIVSLGENRLLAAGLGHKAPVCVDIDSLLQTYASADVEAPLKQLIIDACDLQAQDATAAQAASLQLMRSLQQLMALPGLAQTELLLVTQGVAPVQLPPNESSDKAQPLIASAAQSLWGLMRAVRAEYGSRSLRLLDIDEVVNPSLAAALQSTVAESILRGGSYYRLTLKKLAEQDKQPVEVASLDPSKTVLVTGATGGIGAELCLHLVRQSGVKHLLLLSQRGSQAPNAAALIADLEAAGADTVQLLACDVADRVALEQALTTIPSEQPLGAIYHTAGVVRDATLNNATAEQLQQVFAAKAQAAWHLHQLTAERQLSQFVLFSSAVSVLGNLGQVVYAAANGYLDGLASLRRQQGLAATALGWGPWAQVGMASRLASAERDHLASQGLPLLDNETALSMLQQALQRPEPVLLPMKIDTQALAAEGASPSPLMLDLIPGKTPTAQSKSAPASSLAKKLGGMSADERAEFLLELVCHEVSELLDLGGADAVAAESALQDLGLDSLMALELRSKIAKAAGTKLPATLVFDYPTPKAIAALLASLVQPAEGGAKTTGKRKHNKRDEPIAIVSMACRLPGGVESPEDLWTLLEEERDAVTTVPTSRWDISPLYSDSKEDVGTIYANAGGFVGDVDSFDAGFFGIGPQEAVTIDPQQRLLLETAWEATERAGIVPGTLEGSNTGVYVGICGTEYQSRALADPMAIDAYSHLGTAHASIVGRISYFMGLKGPNFPVDTACSSSLVALHLASQALRNGECDMAFAGGVNLLLDPNWYVYFSRLGALSPTGKCHSFSDDADGYVRGEGCALVLLKRLSDAVRDGDEILATVRGSAVNQDGKSNGFTAPNGPAQQDVIRRALEMAGIEANSVDAVECHGTGTALGDPIEVQALAAVYGEGRKPQQPIVIGSLKSNVGHSEGSAGIAGVLKAVLCLQHQRYAKSLHFNQPSANIPWDELPVQVASEAMAWPATDQPRRIGVSSFGFSGTNSHVILEEAPESKTLETQSLNEIIDTEPQQLLPLTLSACDDVALRAQAQRWADWLQGDGHNSRWSDVVATAALQRSHFDARAVLVAADIEEAVSTLRTLANADFDQRLVQGSAAQAGKLAVLFTGQGSQRTQMGMALYEQYPAYRTALDEICNAVDAHLSQPLLPLLQAPADSAAAQLLDQTEFTQPALFAIEVALFRLWQQWGIKPAMVAGHSIGELSAAHVAGVLDLADAAKLVCARGRLMQACQTGGAMVSIEASEAEVQAAIASVDGVDIAGLNGPRQTVLSGDEAAVLAVTQVFSDDGRRSRRLQVSHAFHSNHMDAMLDEYTSIAATCQFNAPKIALVSLLTGELATSEQLAEPSYWAQQVRSAVRFLSGMQTMQQERVNAFLECGPDGVLAAMGPSCLDDSEQVQFIASLRRSEDEPLSLLKALGALHASGQTLKWSEIVPKVASVAVKLPTYAFQRQRYWLEQGSEVRSVSVASRAQSPALNTALTTTTDEMAAQLRNELSVLPDDERLPHLTFMVRGEVAAVLGLASSERALPDQVLQELGLTSLTAVELRTRLSVRTGITLPATLAFDYPTPQAIAELLLEQAFTDLVQQGGQQQRQVKVDEPIAIVSMACRLPGGVETPAQFWQLLEEGRDVIAAFPARWDNLSLYDPDPDMAGKCYTREGGFLDNIDLFDAAFFGISPREAISMDPQQRMVLETAWEALERGGIVPATLMKSSTGVFVGSTGSDYDRQMSLEQLDGYQGTGNLSSVISGRLAYVLGLEGPALTVDTACSSSLVAMHLASNALRNGECDMAISAGINIMTTPTFFVDFARVSGLSSDGRCKSFSDQADGAAWAEACGVMVLKRLADAERDGNPVQALIRGTASNQDGRSQGMSAPNGPSQQRVIRQALAACDLQPEDIDAIEAHGTGTALGDPIEAGALAAVFAAGRSEQRPLYLGSSKANLGHSAASAGVIGVMKMVLALQHEQLPQTLHAEQPSSKIEWQGSGLSLLQQARPWPRSEQVRRAGISSFGISGTNAHVILQEAPVSLVAERSERQSVQQPLLLPVSGRDQAALQAQAGQMADWLIEQQALPNPLDLIDVAYSAACQRSHFDQRACVTASSLDSAIESLQALQQGQSAVGTSLGYSASEARLAVLFTGQGSQRIGMGRALYGKYATFTDALNELCEALDPYLPQPLLPIIFAEQDSAAAPLLDQTAYTQPALFAIEVALYRQWREWGVKPAVVAGHSIGELSAAHVAGVFNLDDAAKLVCARGRLMQACQAGGAMLSVQASEAEVAAVLSTVDAQLAIDIAGLNGPQQTVVSGDQEAVAHVAEIFAKRERRTRQLQVSHAFHSAHMDGMLDAYRQVAQSCQFAAPATPLVSTVTGLLADTAELTSADYWVRQVRQAVRFTDAMLTMQQMAIGCYLECGPDAVLSALGSQALQPQQDGADAYFVASLRRSADDLACFTNAIGDLHCHGVKVDWQALLQPYAPQPVDLPTYAFQKQSFWLEPISQLRDASAMGLTDAGHPLLGAAMGLADSDAFVFTGRLSLAEQPWLADHGVFDSVLFPGTGMLELAQAAAQQVGCSLVQNLTLAEPLILQPEAMVHLQLSVAEQSADGSREFGLYSRPEDAASGTAWTQHASGLLSNDSHTAIANDDVQARFERLKSWPIATAEAIDIDDLYPRLHQRGLQYGPNFQGLKEVSRVGNTFYARVELPDNLTGAVEQYGLHPALLDAALHTTDFALASEGGDAANAILLPFEWSDVLVQARGASEIRVEMDLQIHAGGQQASLALAIVDASGEPVASVGQLQLRRASAQQIKAATQAAGSKHLYRVDFTPVNSLRDDAQEQPPVWLLQPFADTSNRVDSLCHSGVSLQQALQANLAADLDDAFNQLQGRLADKNASRVAQLVIDLTHLDVATQQRLVQQPSALLDDIYQVTDKAVEWLQQWCARPEFERTELIWLTRDAIAASADDSANDLLHAGIWGLVRAVRAENLQRHVRLIDCGVEALTEQQLQQALAIDNEPELVIRAGVWQAPRLTPASAGEEALLPPPESAWRLAIGERGRLDSLQLEPIVAEPLLANNVRVEIRAAGMNFRDVLNCLGMVHADYVGLEGAGVVTEVGDEVSHLQVGDRVMGLIFGCFATETQTDARMLVKIPDSLSFTEAATMPLVYLTVYYAFNDLSALQAGQKVLIHAAAGGVGIAATQLATHMGAELFGTASLPKWGKLRELGYDDDHIASSRNTEFAKQWLTSTAGAGVDVVLNALAGEYVDASLGLLPRGGHFLEMGKTDARNPDVVAEQHPGVHYKSFDLIEAGPQRIGEMLLALVDLLQQGAITPLPALHYDLRQAPSAYRFMAQARHVGKLVLVPPRQLDLDGTVLMTGGTGELGQAIAKHLVTQHGVRHFAITSRRGMQAPGAQDFVDQLLAAGAVSVDVLPCDASKRDDLARVIDSIPARHPLNAVIHMAGVLDDGVLQAQNPERFKRVMCPKVDGALYLHELTEQMDLAAFVMFSSVAGTFGSPGQTNYSTANSFLDALATYRHKRGLAATALAWGLWAQAGVGMTAHLSKADLARLQRQGVGPMPVAEGLKLLDAALLRPEAQLVPSQLDLKRMQRELENSGEPAAILRSLLRQGRRQASSSAAELSAVKERLAGLPDAEQVVLVTELVQAEIAAVLGLSGAEAVPAQQVLDELGLDSLMAVEIRNRLSSMVAESLPATLLFDYPSSARIAGFLLSMLEPESADEQELSNAESMSDDEIRALMLSIPVQAMRDSGVLGDLLKQGLLTPLAATDEESFDELDGLDELDDDQLVLEAMQMLTDSEDA